MKKRPASCSARAQPHVFTTHGEWGHVGLIGSLTCSFGGRIVLLSSSAGTWETCIVVYFKCARIAFAILVVVALWAKRALH